MKKLKLREVIQLTQGNTATKLIFSDLRTWSLNYLTILLLSVSVCVEGSEE